jgi:hypothetical protein
MLPVSDSHPLRRLFAGLTEQTFIGEIGVTDTQLIDYLSELLTRFIHRDSIYAVRGPDGRQLEELAAMMVEADREKHTRDARREIFRHMGDFALFWTGVYPEALVRSRSTLRQDVLISYSEQGKRSYYLASTYTEGGETAAQGEVLRRLSADFELCAHGLRQVRRQWEQYAA